MNRAVSRGGGSVLELRLLRVAVILFLLLRVLFFLRAGLFGDEAYYWLWGQQPALSYFDHPPLHAWLLWLVSRIFGWTPWSVRLLTWLSLAGVLLIFADWARRLAPEDPPLAFWRISAVYLASPIFIGLTGVAFNDHLVVAFGLLSIHCFVLFVSHYEDGAPEWRRWLYGAAIALGLAGLSKYNAVFIGLGFPLVFLIRPRLRLLLATPHPWIAALIAAAMQAPVLYWNLTEGMASFRFHFGDRWGGDAGHLDWTRPAVFVLENLIFLSPFLAWPLARLWWTPQTTAFGERARGVTLGIFVLSTASFLVVALFFGAYFYWNIIAYIGLVPLLAVGMRSGVLRWIHIGFGLVLASTLVFNFTVFPITATFGINNRYSGEFYDWDKVATHVAAVAAKTPTDVLATTDYQTAALLDFHLHRLDVIDLAPRPSQFRIWLGEPDLRGKSALVLIDLEAGHSGALGWLQNNCSELVDVDDFTVSAGGRTVYKWRLVRCDNRPG